MKFGNLLKIAYRSLAKNKMRTFLTMLGIIIGVASVVAMLGIGQGSRQSIQSSISSLGTNVIMIMPSAQNVGGVRSESGTGQKLIPEDAQAIRQFCPDVAAVSPIVRSVAQVVVGSQNWRTSIFGANTDYFTIRNLKVMDGNIFSPAEERSSAKVCLMGQTVADNLFGEGSNPVGQTIRVNKIPFKVIGLLDKKGQNTFGQDQDDILIAPFNTVQKRMLGVTIAQQILVSANSEDVITKASDEINDLLMQRHKVTDPSEADFTIRTQSELSSIFSATTMVMSVLLASIAGISLLVGGIGIMNIMLVSITERTREIGLRMAVGAKSRDVLLQFLIEAMFLSFIGGLIGLVLGIGVSQLVANLMGWPVVVTVNSILLSFLFSSAIGVFFGWYPARKAARLHPIEALRYE